jgi:Cu/Ag efflux protein CusF
MTRISTTAMAVSVLCVASTLGLAAQMPVSKVDSVTTTATIQAIDATTRRVTLRLEKGDEDTFVVGPAVTRFDELKVGDKIKMTYYESRVYQIRKPGETANVPGESSAITAATSKLPGGTVARQVKSTVTVVSVDPSVPSITVKTDDGRTVTRKVEDKKHLAGVQPGDRIDVTYTEALLMSVTRQS